MGGEIPVLPPSAVSSRSSKSGTLSSRDAVVERYREGLKQREADPDRIIYDGEDLKDLDPDLVVLSVAERENPRSWKRSTKWRITILLGAYAFFAPFTSTIFAPALKSVMEDLNETNAVLGALQIGIFLIAFAVTPVFLAPLSEIYGRTIIVRTGNIMFVAFCVGGGFAQTTAQLAVCRFFSGVGGSSSLAVYGGVLADLWDLKDRARASAALVGALLIGPVLGPVCGGWLSQRISWRWSCWVPAIGAAVLEVIVQFAYKESFVPRLLQNKKAKLVKSNPDRAWYSVLDLDLGEKGAQKTTTTAMIIESVSRPLIYLFLDPVVALLSLYYAFVFGILYLVIATFQIVFAGFYGQSPGIVGLEMISEGIGALAGTFASAKLLEIIYKRKMANGPELYKPETRLISAFPGAFCVTIGLFIYGFTAGRAHFIVPLVGICIFSFGMTNTYMSIQLYLIDSYDFPASAIAAVSALRCIFGGVFPLFGERLFHAIGVDWGVGMLAFMTLALGGPFFPLIYRYGEKLRAVGVRNRSKAIE